MERRVYIALCMFLACRPCALALNPSLDVDQYAHFAWTVREGFFKGFITSIAQTPDGYLWLGTELGLLRFDGVRSVPWQPPAGEHLPSGSIRSLLAARDGRLWIGTTEGLASLKDGKLTHYPEIAGFVHPLLEDHEGTIWAGGFVSSTGRLCAIQSGGTHCYREDGSFGREVGSLCEDSRGYLWVGVMNGLWRWKPGPGKFYPMPDQGPASGLSEDDAGTLLIVTRDGGIRQLVDGKAEAYTLPGDARPSQPIWLLRDRNGGLWIGTVVQGVWHLHQGRTDSFERADGLSGDRIQALLEDREGNIWLATDGGLDRFRNFAIPTISVKQGLSHAFVSSVVAAKDGSFWFGTRDGLDRWNHGQITIYRKGSTGLPDNFVESVFEDSRGSIWVSAGRGVGHFENGRFTPVTDVPAGGVHSIVGDGVGNVWLNQDQSLFHLRNGTVVERIPWAQLGRTGAPRSMLLDTRHGGLWLGFEGSVGYFKDGQVRASYGEADGLGKGRTTGLQLDRDGALWAATEGGLSRLKNGRIATLTSRNGLPCDTVHWVMEDDDHSFWLYTACGLVCIARTELDAWAADSKRAIRITVLDSSDGVSSHPLPMYSTRVAKSSDGKIWFLPLEGVSVIDPLHLPFNQLPPPIDIQQITADRKTYETSSKLRLPALVRDLEIDYTALGLAAPEKIRFRYKLEGRDRDWQDAGDRRQAFYNDLPPRNYRFRVAASNYRGVWNEAGASFDFSIAPAYYQTTWFRVSCVAVFLALLGAMHWFRLRQVAREFNAHLEGRVDERLRVARELHDTLLQSFNGVLLRFQAVYNLLPGRGAEARQVLESAMNDGAQAVTEARKAVQDMRSSAAITNDLAAAIESFGEELAGQQRASNQDASAFSVEVEGTAQDLHPILRGEVYRIAGEALRNAFRHAHAGRIEVEIRYDARQLRLRVRDDGVGIDPKVLKDGRAGHWGLGGIRERTNSIGGQLEVWSEHNAGTEVELTIPASVAYGSNRRRRFRLFKHKVGASS